MNNVQLETLFSSLCYFAPCRRRCGKGSTTVQLLLIGNVPVMQLEPFLQTFSSKFRNYVVPSLPTHRRHSLLHTLPHFHVYQTPYGETERVQIGVGREALGPWSLMVSISKLRRLKVITTLGAILLPIQNTSILCSAYSTSTRKMNSKFTPSTNQKSRQKKTQHFHSQKTYSSRKINLQSSTQKRKNH